MEEMGEMQGIGIGFGMRFVQFMISSDQFTVSNSYSLVE